MDFNKEINHYEVEVEAFVSDTRSYQHLVTRSFDTMEDAILYARKSENMESRVRVSVRVIENIIGWWEE